MSIKGTSLFELLMKWGVDHARSRNHSKVTIKTNKKFVNLYYRYLNGKEHSADSCNQFLSDGRCGKVTKTHWKNETVITRSKKLKAFTNWLHEYEEVIEKNWSRKIWMPTVIPMEYDTIGTKKWEELIVVMTEIKPEHNKKEVRTRTEKRFYLLTLLKMSMRGGEPFTITTEDINLDADRPYVWVTGKGKNGGKRRKVLIHPMLIEDFKKRRFWDKIFTANQESLQKEFRKLRVKLGLPKNLTMHKMRHETGTEMIDNGASLTHVSRVLGHSNTRMVEKYYYKGNLRDYESSLKAFAPTWASSNSSEEYIKHLMTVLERSGVMDNKNINLDLEKIGSELLLHAKPK
jgi:integrase